MNTIVSNLRTTGTTNNMLDEIHDIQLPDTMLAIKRLMEGGMPALDFYPGQIGYLESQFSTVFGLQAALYINHIDTEIVKMCLQESKGKDVKPVDVYRKFSYSLRRIAARRNQNSGNALDLLRSLSLEQTRPFGELEGQPWIDGYTGEVESIDEALEVGKACDKWLTNNLSVAANVNDDLLVVANECHWGDKEITQHIQAQEGFNADGDEPDEELDDRGYNPPTFLQPADYISDDDHELRIQITKFNAARRLVVNRMKKDNVPADLWTEEYKARIEDAAKAFMRGTDKVLDDDIQIEMVSQILLGKVLDVAEATGEHETPMATAEPIGENDQDLVDPHFLEDLSKTFNQDQQNPINTAAWNIGKIKATMAGATLEDANKVAWQAWKSHKATIKSIQSNKSGLILDSGRKISWVVAQMKLTHNELDIDANTKARLLKKLAELHVNNSFTKTLAK